MTADSLLKSVRLKGRLGHYNALKKVDSKIIQLNRKINHWKKVKEHLRLKPK